MAENSVRQLANYPETRDKIVQNIELRSDHAYYGITIKFTDQTALNFTFESAVFAFPTYSDWTDSDETILKKYELIRSHVGRE